MKKLLLCSLALVMVVLAIAGCGKSTSSSSATTKELTFNGETYTVPKDPQRMKLPWWNATVSFAAPIR